MAWVFSQFMGIEGAKNYDGGFLEWNKLHPRAAAHKIDHNQRGGPRDLIFSNSASSFAWDGLSREPDGSVSVSQSQGSLRLQDDSSKKLWWFSHPTFKAYVVWCVAVVAIATMYINAAN